MPDYNTFTDKQVDRIAESCRVTERDKFRPSQGYPNFGGGDGFYAKITAVFNNSLGYAWEALKMDANTHAIGSYADWGSGYAYHIYGCTTLPVGIIIRMVNDDSDFAVEGQFTFDAVVTSPLYAGSYGTVSSHGYTGVRVDNPYSATVNTGTHVVFALHYGGWKLIGANCT